MYTSYTASTAGYKCSPADLITTQLYCTINSDHNILGLWVSSKATMPCCSDVTMYKKANRHAPTNVLPYCCSH